MNTYNYYPGCTLKDRAKKLDVCARLSASALGIELAELPEWQCCGAVYPQVSDEIATRLSAVRALIAAASSEDGTNTLVTMCSACHHVLKRTAYDLNADAAFLRAVKLYLGDEYKNTDETRVLHFLELLRDEIGFDVLKSKVVKPLTGRKIGAFYGCMLLRPGKQLAFDDPEDPSCIEDFIRALGAEPVRYSYRNECCGSYIALESTAIAKEQSSRVVASAKAAGAEELVTACPLCLYNLTKYSADALPVKYFTELLAEALGLDAECEAKTEAADEKI